MNIYLTPAEVAGIIHARAGDLCHAVTYPGTESEEESVPELICNLREAVDALEEARIDKSEGHPIPPEGEVLQPCEPTDEQRKVINRIWETTTKLADMATYKYDGRELPGDAAEAVGALEELVEAVKTLYGFNDEENEDETPADCVK